MELINNKTLPEKNIKIKELDYYEKVSIKDRIDKLTKEGKIEILRIISKNNEVYSAYCQANPGGAKRFT